MTSRPRPRVRIDRRRDRGMGRTIFSPTCNYNEPSRESIRRIIKFLGRVEGREGKEGNRGGGESEPAVSRLGSH